MTPDRGRPLELGDLISALYEHFYRQFGDEELASVAASAVINEYLALRDRQDDVRYVN